MISALAGKHSLNISLRMSVSVVPYRTSAVQGDSVVYGDAEGLVHWLSRNSGDAQLRLPTAGRAVAAPPAVDGRMLLVVTRAGGLHAFRAR